jgi:hypothetical protein
MQTLFSSQEKKILSQVDKTEKELQQFIWNNQKVLFPQYTFITQEFSLKGAVHGSGSSGRIGTRKRRTMRGQVYEGGIVVIPFPFSDLSGSKRNQPSKSPANQEQFFNFEEKKQWT